MNDMLAEKWLFSQEMTQLEGKAKLSSHLKEYLKCVLKCKYAKSEGPYDN